MKDEFYTGNWNALAEMKRAMQTIEDKYEKNWASELVSRELPEIMEYRGVTFTSDELKKAVELHYREPILSAKPLDDFKIMFSSINHPMGTCTLDMLNKALHTLKPEELLIANTRDRYVA